MNVYRLAPIDPGHPSWQASSEKGCVWVAAPNPKAARELVAKKSAVALLVATRITKGLKSPWQDAAITSCVLEPSVTHINDGTVVRADGSRVGD